MQTSDRASELWCKVVNIDYGATEVEWPEADGCRHEDKSSGVVVCHVRH